MVVVVRSGRMLIAFVPTGLVLTYVSADQGAGLAFPGCGVVVPGWEGWVGVFVGVVPVCTNMDHVLVFGIVSSGRVSVFASSSWVPPSMGVVSIFASTGCIVTLAGELTDDEAGLVFSNCILALTSSGRSFVSIGCALAFVSPARSLGLGLCLTGVRFPGMLA